MSELDQAVTLLRRLQELMVHAHSAGYDQDYREAMLDLDRDMLKWAQENNRSQLGFNKST